MSTQHRLRSDSFTLFVTEMSPRLQHALVARYGLDLGQESAAHAPLITSTNSDGRNPIGLVTRQGSSLYRGPFSSAKRDTGSIAGMNKAPTHPAHVHRRVRNWAVGKRKRRRKTGDATVREASTSEQ